MVTGRAWIRAKKKLFSKALTQVSTDFSRGFYKNLADSAASADQALLRDVQLGMSGAYCRVLPARLESLLGRFTA